jgi:hypothetical protein
MRECPVEHHDQRPCASLHLSFVVGSPRLRHGRQGRLVLQPQPFGGPTASGLA